MYGNGVLSDGVCDQWEPWCDLIIAPSGFAARRIEKEADDETP